MAQRNMLFEESVMRFAGVTEIPTFEHPNPGPEKKKVLGHACMGKKIEACHSWLQQRAPKRVVNGKELQMVVSQEQLTNTLCRVCTKG